MLGSKPFTSATRFNAHNHLRGQMSLSYLLIVNDTVAQRGKSNITCPRSWRYLFSVWLQCAHSLDGRPCEGRRGLSFGSCVLCIVDKGMGSAVKITGVLSLVITLFEKQLWPLLAICTVFLFSYFINFLHSLLGTDYYKTQSKRWDTPLNRWTCCFPGGYILVARHRKWTQ